MPGWKDEYLSSLLEAEKNSPVNQDLVEACSQLNDRIATLEAEKAHWQSSSSSSTKNPPPPKQQQPPASTTTTTAPSSSEPPPLTTTTTPTPNDPIQQARLRTDLAEALRQNTSLESRLRRVTTERDALLATSRSQSRSLRELASERDALRLRVRDQSEELRGKKQMLEQVQDEVLALDMQLNVAEQQKARIAAENKQLIERWMRRARQEADDMNAANERRD
ncbi:hypothetical protein VMCG_00675 [Cytospora schulzeri]|uniref:Autophagy-related protein 16 domain-containing protein n=1 Tax=Cytospora schulzeri TaxID=448051 RepID=A0A423X8S6_9PEZI|nr:hypothetical protein VMCG_00675 [Valsa malicola]